MNLSGLRSRQQFRGAVGYRNEHLLHLIDHHLERLGPVVFLTDSKFSHTALTTGCRLSGLAPHRAAGQDRTARLQQALYQQATPTLDPWTLRGNGEHDRRLPGQLCKYLLNGPPLHSSPSQQALLHRPQ